MIEYATITSDKMKWTKGKDRKKYKIINPIFEHCIELIDDPYWKSIFTKAVTGKLPTGFSYKDGHLIYKRGNKVKKTLLSGTPIEILTCCLDFFRENGGLYSDIDKEKDLIDRSNVVTFYQKSWGEISKNTTLKKLLINSYIRSITNKDEYEYLKTLVNMGMIVGIISDNDIEYKDGNIVSINGIIKENNKWILVDNGKRKKLSSNKVKTKTNTMDYYSLWYKYIMGLRNEITQTMDETDKTEETED